MNNIINAGVIGCDMSEEFFQASALNKVEKFNWKKIWVSNKKTGGIAKEYPEAKIVNDIEAIVNDTDITLVIVSANHLKYVKPVIEAGKAVRVIG